MFDIGWPEMAVIMMVAIIVIGPKDLPRMARTIGKWTGKARAMARDFQRSLDDMAREAELDEVKKSIEKAGSAVGSPNRMKSTMTNSLKSAIDPDDDLGDAFDVNDDAATTAPAAGKPAVAQAKPAAPLQTAQPASTAQPTNDKNDA